VSITIRSLLLQVATTLLVASRSYFDLVDTWADSATSSYSSLVQRLPG